MWHRQPNKPPPGYVRPWLTDEEFYKMQAYVSDIRRSQLSEEEQKKKCGASARYEKPCPDIIRLCHPIDKEPEFVCPGEKKGDRMPLCAAPKPLLKPPKCPVYNHVCQEEVLGEAVLFKKAEEKKREKNSGAYKCPADDDESCLF